VRWTVRIAAFSNIIFYQVYIKLWCFINVWMLPFQENFKIRFHVFEMLNLMG